MSNSTLKSVAFSALPTLFSSGFSIYRCISNSSYIDAALLCGLTISSVAVQLTRKVVPQKDLPKYRNINAFMLLVIFLNGFRLNRAIIHEPISWLSLGVVNRPLVESGVVLVALGVTFLDNQVSKRLYYILHELVHFCVSTAFYFGGK